MCATQRRGSLELRGPALVLALVLCLTLAPAAARAEESLSEGSPEPTSAAAEQPSCDEPEDGADDEAVGGTALDAQVGDTLVATTGADKIDRNGYLALSVTRDEIESLFDYGDMLSVTIGGQTFEAPLVDERTFVDQLQPAIVVHQKSDGSCVVELGADNDKFARTFGIAEKDDAGWHLTDGLSDPLTVTISLAEKGGYYDRYLVKQLRYTDKRTDYPQLTDAQFANFREVTTTGIAPGVLYRAATPVNPQRGRNTYSDACIREAGVTYAINLSDSDEKLVKYRGYDDSYYATIDHIALHASIHLDSEEYRQDLMRGFRAMAEKPGVYLIHCLEGKDRTGIAVALLEFLMGASYDEVIADHMVSFYNYFGMTADDPDYESIVHGNLTAFLESYFGVDTLKGRTDLQQKAEEYMLAGGLTPEEIAALKHNLNPAADTQQEDSQQNRSGALLGESNDADGQEVTPADEGAKADAQAGSQAATATTTQATTATEAKKDESKGAKADATAKNDNDASRQGASTGASRKPLPKTSDPYSPVATTAFALAGLVLTAAGLGAERRGRIH